MRLRSIIGICLLSLGLLSCGSGQSTSSTVPSPEVLQSLPGNYSMKIQLDGQTHYSTAVVSQVAVGQYQIARITVYGPVRYGFTLGPDATVQSQELGEGCITYQLHIKKTTIRFEKEDRYANCQDSSIGFPGPVHGQRLFQ